MRFNLKIFKSGAYVFMGLLFVLSSCNTNKYLQGEQKYVAPSKYKLQADEKIKNKSDLQFELSTLEKQKPNAKLLGLARTRLWYFYRIQAKQDSSKFNKWIARIIAEEPSILDSIQTQQSAENMATYLKRKGYFDTTVDWSIKNKKHTAYSKYDVNLSSMYRIDTAIVRSRDTPLIQLIQRFSDATFLKKGQPVSYENYQLERNRIREILRNHGYAQFQNNFITRFRGDSTLLDDKHKVRIEYDIITPTDTTYHKRFRIGDITIIPEYTPETSLLQIHDTIINDIKFKTLGGKLKVKPKVILENVFLTKGELYRQQDQDKTSLQLSNLGVYRFVTLKPVFSADKAETIDFEIYLSPNKKLALGINAEINNTNRTSTSTSLVGTALSINWRNRNLFKGAELLLFDIEGGLEIDPSSSNRLISNVNFSPEVSLFIPRFIDYLGLWKKIGGKGKDGNPGFYQKLVDNASSRYSLRYSYVSLDNFYTFNSFESSFGYNVDNIGGKSYSIDHIGIDYLTPTIDSTFASTAPELLKRSLTRQFFTGFIFKELDKRSVRRISRKNSTQTTLLHVEQSGLEAFGVDKIFSGQDTLTIGNSELSKFLAISYDWSRVRRINVNNALAIRLFFGGVTPFGDSEVVPFVKQYNAGGPNSIRAWRLYELGPGSYRDPRLDDPGTTQNVIQSGEIKFEANLEYRFDLFWRLKSALFVDAGNIWTLKNDPERPGSTLKTRDFFKELAIGSGIGFRFDFTYFIFRVDVGWKAKTPYINSSGKRWNLNSLSDFSKSENRYTSIALGYPF